MSNTKFTTPSITVELGDRSYPIFTGSALRHDVPLLIKEQFPKSRVGLVTNTAIAQLYPSLVEFYRQQLGAAVHILPDGEEHKNLATWGAIFDTLLNARLDRSSVIIALGGGVVGDMVGFAAATLLRGVAFVQIPTTLLAMVDSSVGGKTGINHPMGKNLIGAFHQPTAVVVDTDFITTLPDREFRAGYAELFKYAFIGGREMFDFVAASHTRMLSRDSEALTEGIKRSIAIKAGVVSRDERESGERALLNFGHTFGHALEHYFHFSGIMHGEAVAWGVACAIELGCRIGSIPKDAQGEYRALLSQLQLPPLPNRPETKALYEAMHSDKKSVAGTLKFIVPTIPGTSVIRNDIDKETVCATIDAVL